MAQGRYVESRSLFTSALRLARRALPPTHPRVAEVEAALGDLALAEAKPGDAIAPLRSALAWQVTNHAPLEPETAETALQLARALAQLGQRSEADSLFEQAAQRLERNPYRAAHARAASRERAEWRRRWGRPPSSG
jgi:tetratricopeptide (TPR) repeat protein